MDRRLHGLSLATAAAASAPCRNRHGWGLQAGGQGGVEKGGRGKQGVGCVERGTELSVQDLYRERQRGRDPSKRGDGRGRKNLQHDLT